MDAQWLSLLCEKYLSVLFNHKLLNINTLVKCCVSVVHEYMLYLSTALQLKFKQQNRKIVFWNHCLVTIKKPQGTALFYVHQRPE